MRTGAGLWPGCGRALWWEGRGWFRASGPPGLLKGLGLGHRLAVERQAGQEKIMDGNNTTASKGHRKPDQRPWAEGSKTLS